MEIVLLILLIACFGLGYFMRVMTEDKPTYAGDLILAKINGEPVYTYLEMEREGILEDLQNGQTVYFLVRSKKDTSYNEGTNV